MPYTRIFDGSLSELQQKVALKMQLEVKLSDLQTQRCVFERDVAELRADHRKEQADVDRLEGRSLAKYFYQHFGKLDEKLDDERREAAAAMVKLDAAERELAAVDHQIQQVQAQLQDLYGCEEAYSAALEEKRNAVRSSGTPEASRILRLEEKIAFLESQKREIREAIAAGNSALETADSVLSELQDAAGWNTWDMIGGGGIITHMAKHGHLDEAQEMVEQLQSELRLFKTELADINIHADMQMCIDGFLRFADYFFDNLFTDWAVGDKISQSHASVQKVKNDILATLSKLEQMEEKNDTEISALEVKIEELLVNG